MKIEVRTYVNHCARAKYCM